MQTKEEKKIKLGQKKTEQFFKEVVELANYLERDFIRVSLAKRPGDIYLGDLGKSLDIDYTGFHYSTGKEDERAKYNAIHDFIKKFQRYKGTIIDAVMSEKRHKESGHHHVFVSFDLYTDDIETAYKNFVGEDYMIEKEKNNLEKTIQKTTATPKKLKM
jgi:hypothetical protein